MGKPKYGKNKSRDRLHSSIPVSATEKSNTSLEGSSVSHCMDEYTERKQKNDFATVKKPMKMQQALEEEILEVATSSDNEEVDYTHMSKRLKYSICNVSMHSSCDEAEESNDCGDNLQIDKWGNRKSAYYNADYVGDTHDASDNSNEDVADLEEQEALSIQKRITQQLDNEDFGLNFISSVQVTKGAGIKEYEEKINLSVSQLNIKEKLKLLEKESPEVFYLTNDFHNQLNEICNSVMPALRQAFEADSLSHFTIECLKTRYQMIINYCIHIAYYFMMKSRNIPVQNHPLMKQLVEYRSLLLQLEDGILNFPLKLNHDILTEEKNGNREKGQGATESSKKCTRSSVNACKTTNKLEKSLFANEISRNVEQSNHLDDIESFDNKSVKRGINYEIAKNRGLVPHRKKEQRNPRVKNRLKFRKATIRRKGQIREPRKELQRYGGEVSGIKASVVRSVKLK